MPAARVNRRTKTQIARAECPTTDLIALPLVPSLSRVLHHCELVSKRISAFANCFLRFPWAFLVDLLQLLSSLLLVLRSSFVPSLVR